MKAVVIYDSWFKNTRQIAEAIADGLGDDVQVIKVDVDPNRYVANAELVVAGSPTHGGVATPAMQDFLNSLNADDLEGIAVAAFDTRIRARWLKVIGFAGPRIAKQLQRKDGTLIAPPEGFFVAGKEGPLIKGELERATAWGVELASRVKEGAFV